VLGGLIEHGEHRERLFVDRYRESRV